MHIHIYIFITYFTVWNARSVLCLSQNEIVKCSLIVADSCKITLDLIKLHNG